MKALILLFVCVMGFAAQTFGQASGGYWYNENNRFRNKIGVSVAESQFINNNEMIFEVDALINVKANAYTAIFNMTQVGETAVDADRIMAARYNAFVTELKDKGIATESIFLDMVSLIPIYELAVDKKLFSKTYQEVPAGFELMKNVHIVYEDAATLDAILTIAANNEIYELIKVDYFVTSTDSIYNELREETVAFMNDKISDLNDLGVRLDTLYKVVSEKSTAIFPTDRYTEYSTYSSSSIQAVKKKSDAVVRKPKVMFYNQLNYHDFDIVINPIVAEPVVQYTYNLKVKYVVKHPQVRVQNHYKLLTPTGELKTIEVK